MTNKLPIMKLVLIKKCICTVQRWQEEHKSGLNVHFQMFNEAQSWHEFNS